MEDGHEKLYSLGYRKWKQLEHNFSSQQQRTTNKQIDIQTDRRTRRPSLSVVLYHS